MKQAPIVSGMRVLSDWLRLHAASYALGAAWIATYQYCEYRLDTSLAPAIDTILGGHGQRAPELGARLVVIACAALAFRVLAKTRVSGSAQRIEYELRRGIVEHLARLGPSFYRSLGAGEIISRATNDLTQVRMLLGFGTFTALNAAFGLVSALAVTLQVSAALTLSALAVMPLMLFAMRGFARSMFVLQRENQEALGAVTQVVQSNLSGIRLVKSFTLEAAEEERFAAANGRYMAAGVGIARLRAIMVPVVQSITAVGMIVVLLHGGYMMISHAITAGQFLVFSRALTRLVFPLVSVGVLVSFVQRGRASYERLWEMLAHPPEAEDGPGPTPAVVTGHLRVCGLGFRERDTPLLEDIGFELGRGESIAIVGRTGSGKSTLAALLIRLLPTPRGRVFIDGVDVCELPLEFLHRTIGYMDQRALLFSTSVRNNIGRGLVTAGDAPREPVEVAADEAQVRAEIEALPNGFDTPVGERGVQLSGGQRQRVSLARALVTSPPILVLDDPFSAVDSETERLLLEAIERRKPHCTLVLITHRARVAARCDRILVLEGGRPVALGTHSELAGVAGPYAEFLAHQRQPSRPNAGHEAVGATEQTA